MSYKPEEQTSHFTYLLQKQELEVTLHYQI
jgi:hypothetical protein